MERQVQTVLRSLYSLSWLDLENTKVKVSLERNDTAILAHLSDVSNQSGQAMVRILYKYFPYPNSVS